MSWLTRLLGLELVERPANTLSSTVEDQIDKILWARSHHREGAWRVPSVREALGVPAIHRAVALISSTTGMLSMQAFRNGSPMVDPPRIVVRPDPDEAPGTFYEQTAANLAKYGELIWYITSFNTDGLAEAVINVPLAEIHVDNNPANRRRAEYRWGAIKSTRWTPANPTGRFVHRKYALNDPFALRGEGPLQIAKAAVSIAVESQEWAANFYGYGGKPRDIVKYANFLDATPRDSMGELDTTDGTSEVEKFKAQYSARDNNTPIVIDQAIESITHPSIDVGGAQMLDARLHQRGDAALIFGIPGKFAEYVQSGTSLTYQNVEMAFTDLIKSCLQPLYLEPIEQAMSDLLTRTTTARFNVKGFLRADIKTRFEVHGIAIDKGIYDSEYAQREEGILPGDVEYAPVPFSPAPPTPIRAASLALTTDWRCSHCDKKLLDVAGPGSVATCGRCKTRNELAMPATSEHQPAAPNITIHMPSDMVRVESPVTVNPPAVTVHAAEAAPMNVALATNMDLPLAGIAAATERLRAGLEDQEERRRVDSDALTDRLAELAASQAELARSIAAPKVKRITTTRNEAGQLTDAVMIEEPAA